MLYIIMRVLPTKNYNNLLNKAFYYTDDNLPVLYGITKHLRIPNKIYHWHWN